MTRELNSEDLWGNHELSILPLSLFKPNGDMRTGDGKSQLKRILKVEVSRCLIGLPDTIIVDFSAVLYHTMAKRRTIRYNQYSCILATANTGTQ